MDRIAIRRLRLETFRAFTIMHDLSGLHFVSYEDGTTWGNPWRAHTLTSFEAARQLRDVLSREPNVAGRGSLYIVGVRPCRWHRSKRGANGHCRRVESHVVD